jgi:hypothetical protein
MVGTIGKKIMKMMIKISDDNKCELLQNIDKLHTTELGVIPSLQPIK